MAFFINCGIYSQEAARTIGAPVLPNPKEYECLYNARIDHLSKSKNKEFELLSSDENTKTTLANTLISELTAALDFYKNIKNNDDLVDFCIKEGTYFWQNLFRYLAIKKDINRLTQYVKFYGDIFKGDDRRQWFEDEINRILLENGLEKMYFYPENYKQKRIFQNMTP